MQDKNVTKLTDQDAALLEQGASMLEGLESDERNRGNCSTAEGAACSAHAVRRLASALLAHERAPSQCLHQIQEPTPVEQAAWYAGLDEGRAQAAQPEALQALRALHDSVELAMQRGALSERALEIIIMQPATDVLMRAASQAAPAAVAVPDDWMEHLGFELDAAADGIWQVIEDTGERREATLTERVLWKELTAIRAALAATPAADAPLYAEMLAALQSVGMDAVGVGGGENAISNAARAKVDAVLEKIGAPWPSPAPAAAAPVVPNGWVPCVVTYEGQHPEEVAYGPQIMMDRLKKWLERYYELKAAAPMALLDAGAGWAAFFPWWSEKSESMKDVHRFEGIKGVAYDAWKAALAAPPAAAPTTGYVAPKGRYVPPVLFSPYTGEPRDARDIASDPRGVLIVPPGAVLAATPAAVEVPAEGDPAALVQLANLLESGRGLIQVERKEIANALRTLATASAAAAPVVLPEPDGIIQVWGTEGFSKYGPGAEFLHADTVRALLATATGLPAQAVPVANCYSDDDGDTWRDCPDDCEFVEGRALGEEFELQASIRSWAEVFRITKVPDETSDDYEVEPVSIRTTAAPQAQADARDADDAALIEWLSGQYLAADFHWGDPKTSVLVIEIPPTASVCGDFRTDVRAAIAIAAAKGE